MTQLLKQVAYFPRCLLLHSLPLYEWQEQGGVHSLISGCIFRRSPFTSPYPASFSPGLDRRLMKPAAWCTLRCVLPPNMMKLAKGFRLWFYKILQSNHHELKHFHHDVMSFLPSTTRPLLHFLGFLWHFIAVTRPGVWMVNCISFLCVVLSFMQPGLWSLSFGQWLWKQPQSWLTVLSA